MLSVPIMISRHAQPDKTYIVSLYIRCLVLYGLFLVCVWVVGSITGLTRNVIASKLLSPTEYNLRGLMVPGTIGFFVGFFIAVRFNKVIPRAVLIYMSALVIRVIYLAMQINFFLFDDEIVLHKKAVLVFNYQGFPPQYYNIGPYERLVGMLYLLYGVNLLIPKLVNIVIGSLLPFLIYQLTWEMWKDKKLAFNVMAIAAFAPPLVVYSSANLKEIFTMFLILLSLWFLRKDRVSVSNLVLSAFCALALLYFRALFVPPLAAALSVRFLKKGRWRTGTVFWVLLIVGVIISVTTVLIFYYTKYSARLSGFWRDTYLIGRLETSEGVSRILVDTTNVFSPSNVLLMSAKIFFPIEPLLFLIEPTFHNLTQALISLSWVALFPLGILGIVYSIRNYQADKPIIGWGILGLMSVFTPLTAWIGGIPDRHIVVFWPIWLLLSTSSLKLKLPIKLFLSVWTICYVMVLIIYVILRIIL